MSNKPTGFSKGFIKQELIKFYNKYKDHSLVGFLYNQEVEKL